MGKWLHQKHTVEFWECDPSKTVYNSKYFIWFENARFTIAEEAQIYTYLEANSSREIIFPVLESECKFLLPIPLGTHLVIRTKLEEPKMAQLVFKHIVTDEVTNQKYATATTIVGILSSESGLCMTLEKNIKKLIYNYLKVEDIK